MLRKTALITGGTRGTGLSIAKMLNLNGYNVIITGTSLEKTENVANEIGKNVVPLELNLTKIDSIENFGNKIRNNKIDVFVNNAGMLSRDQLEKIEISRYNKMVMVNQFGPQMVSKYVLEKMDSDGTLIYFSPPIVIDNKTSFLTPYMSTKLGQTLFMQMLANKYKNTNMKICSVWTQYGLYTDALMHRKIGNIDNYMSPDIISKTIELLLNEKSKNILGKVIIDHNYLLSQNINPHTYALGSNPLTLEQLFGKS
jgi:short-subunit dehydrogenase